MRDSNILKSFLNQRQHLSYRHGLVILDYFCENFGSMPVWTIPYWIIHVWTIANSTTYDVVISYYKDIWILAVWTIAVWTIAVWTIVVWTTYDDWTNAVWTILDYKDIWTINLKTIYWSYFVVPRFFWAMLYCFVYLFWTS